MADGEAVTIEEQPKKQRLLRTEANNLCVRKRYYKDPEKQQKLRERIDLLYQTKAEVERKIADLEKFLKADFPGDE